MKAVRVSDVIIIYDCEMCHMIHLIINDMMSFY